MSKNEELTKGLNLLEELALEDDEREIVWQKGKYVVYDKNDETLKIIDSFTKVDTDRKNNKTTVKVDDEGTYELTLALWKNLTNFEELFGEDQLTTDMFRKLDSKKHKKRIFVEISAQIQMLMKEYMTLGYGFGNTEEKYLNSMNRQQRREYEKTMKKLDKQSNNVDKNKIDEVDVEIVEDESISEFEEFKKWKKMQKNQGNNNGSIN